MVPQRQRKAIQSRQDEIVFLRDLDLLTAISSQQQPYYRKANLQIGQQMMKSSYVLKQDSNKYNLNCHIDQFQIFGPGIYLLFKLLKYLTFSFGIVSILAIFNMVLLVSGRHPRQSGITNQIKGGVLKNTIYNLTSDDYGMYVGISFAIAVILSVFLVYWSQKQKDYVIQCLKETPLASYSTVILRKLPQNYNQHKLQKFLTQKFGDVAQIYTVRDFGDDLLYYKQMNQIVQDFKQQKVMNRLQPKRKCTQMANLFFQFRSGHLKIKQKIKQSQTFQSVFAFIRFKKIQDRQKLLQIYNQINMFCCLRQKKQKQPQNQQYQNKIQNKQQYILQNMDFIQCEMQPCGILWQNLHLTKTKKLLKSSIMILLVIIVLSISIFLIFLISAIQMSVMNSKFKDMNKQQIRNQHDDYALLSYCINLSFANFYQQSDLCSAYNSQYIKFTIMIFMIPLSISLFKLLLTELMKALVSFRRYAYQIKKIESQSTIIFVLYFFITGVLQLVIYLGNGHISIFKVFTPLIQSVIDNGFQPEKITIFLDYNPDWYITASYNVIMIGAISFNLSAFGIILYCNIRRKLCDYYANKQKLQVQMNKWLTGYVLEIQYIYAALLTIVYFTLLFGGSMPLLYPLAFASFLVLYWTNKYVFINFCAKPLTYNHTINRRVRKILFGALIMHCVFTPVFFRAPLIGEHQINQNFIQRILFQWEYIILFAFLVSYLLFEQPARVLYAILKEYAKNRRNDQKKPTTGEQMPLPYSVHRKVFSLPTIVRKRHNQIDLQSYSMHQNISYKYILRTLYTINNKQRARKTFILNKELFQLYEQNIKTSDSDQVNSHSLTQLIMLAKRDFKRYGKVSKRDPYYQLKRKLYEIYENSKKGKNHKYTLFNMVGLRDMNSSDGFASITGQTFPTQQSSTIKQDLEIQSKILRNNKYVMKQNLSALQKVVQASSNMQDQSQSKSKNHPQNDHQQYKKKTVLSHFSKMAQQAQQQFPQSDKRLNNPLN